MREGGRKVCERWKPLSHEPTYCKVDELSVLNKSLSHYKSHRVTLCCVGQFMKNQ